ncbi:MAG: hypothetical protein RL609_577 [Bacteroidota bacterium]|jgi:hypothetical protein
MKCIVFITFLFWSITFQAQIVNIESQRIQSDSNYRIVNLDGNFSSQLNNQRTLMDYHLGGLIQFKSKDSKNMWLLLINGDRSIADGNDMSNANLLHLRYSHKILPKIKVESFYQIQSNKLLDLKNRQLLGAGLRFKFLASGRCNLYLGSLYMFELESTLEHTTPIGYHRLSNYFSVSIKSIKSNIEFTNIVYYQPLLQNFSDFRLSGQMNLLIPISNRIVFTSNVMCYLDKRPPLDVAPYTYQISHGFRYNFK